MGPAYIEHIRDGLVMQLWEGGDPVAASEYRNKNLIESAVSRPFQTFGGRDVYPTIIEKAAALFHSLISNHPFQNGNKRTAVIAVDLFLTANGYYLVLLNPQMYKLAEQTASYKERGVSNEDSLREIKETLEKYTITISKMGREATTVERKKLYAIVFSLRKMLREHPDNSILDY